MLHIAVHNASEVLNDIELHILPNVDCMPRKQQKWPCTGLACVLQGTEKW